MDVEQQRHWVPAFAGTTAGKLPEQFPSTCQVLTHLASLSRKRERGNQCRRIPARAGMTSIEVPRTITDSLIWMLRPYGRQ